MTACQKPRWWWSFLACAWALPGLAQAQGSHFLIEPQTAVVWSEGSGGGTVWGVDAGALLAVGGKFRGFPPRFYAFIKGTQTLSSLEERDRSASLGDVGFSHRYSKAIGGGRVVIPLFSCLRLNLEMGFGELFSVATYRETGLRPRSVSSEREVMDLGLGLNWRLHPLWSVGVQAEHLMSLDGPSWEESGVGFADGRIALSSLRFSVGLHF